MSLILKVMNGSRGNDAHPRAGYRLLAGVKEVIFREPAGEAVKPSAFIWLHGAEEALVLNLDGSAYVMNEAGRTVSYFEVGVAQQKAAA